MIDEEWEAMKMEARLEQEEERVVYRKIECKVCGEKTSHAKVDTVDGYRFQCENCGTFEGEGNE